MKKGYASFSSHGTCSTTACRGCWPPRLSARGCARWPLSACGALPVAERTVRTVRLRRNNEEQARIDARVTEMQGMMQSIEDDFLLVGGVSDIGPEFGHTIDTIKQRRSVHAQSGV